MKERYFYKMIETLRSGEEVMLYGNRLSVSDEEAKEVVAYLKEEYKEECLDYPFIAPPFDEGAALWGAKTVYVAAQLMLYREDKIRDLESLLPDYSGAFSPSAILSCDMCLRFLPDIIRHLKLIDSEDALIGVLEGKLYTWHYSGIHYPLAVEKIHEFSLPDFRLIGSNACLQQMYVNRVIEYKRLDLARLEALRSLVGGSLGNFGKEFWREFNIETKIHD